MIPKRDIIYICEECGIKVEVKDFQGRKKPSFCKSCVKERNKDSSRWYKKRKRELKGATIPIKTEISAIAKEARENGMSYGQWVARSMR